MPVIVSHGDLAHREVNYHVLIVEASFQADVICHKVPVWVQLRFPQNLPLQRVEYELD